MEEHKQQLAPKPAPKPISDVVELEEINEETEDDKEEKTPIKVKDWNSSLSTQDSLTAFLRSAASSHLTQKKFSQRSLKTRLTRELALCMR